MGAKGCKVNETAERAKKFASHISKFSTGQSATAKVSWWGTELTFYKKTARKIIKAAGLLSFSLTSVFIACSVLPFSSNMLFTADVAALITSQKRPKRQVWYVFPSAAVQMERQREPSSSPWHYLFSVFNTVSPKKLDPAVIGCNLCSKSNVRWNKKKMCFVPQMTAKDNKTKE